MMNEDKNYIISLQEREIESLQNEITKLIEKNKAYKEDIEYLSKEITLKNE